MTARIEKTVFISYRRTNFPWAYCIYQDLTHHGYDVFFDYQSIDSGNFEKIILENIKARAHFIVILAPSALERCNEPNDWLRREIETAMDEGRNITPIMLESFDFGSPLVKKFLTGKLASLSSLNGMSLIAEYMEAGLEKLRNRYLNVALENIHLHTLTDDAKEITETQKTAANEAAPVEKEELSAQEWFERGYIFDKAMDYNEAIRCFTNAIDLKADFPIALSFRGIARRKNDDLEGAVADFDEAIRLGTKIIEQNPENAEAYNNRGAARFFKGDVDAAIEDYNEAIRLKPDSASDFKNRGMAFKHKGNLDDAIIDFNKAIELKIDDASVYLHRGIIRQERGDIEGAFLDFDDAIKIEPNDASFFITRGNARKKMNDLDNALLDYDQAIHLKPNDSDAFYGRGLVKKDKGDLIGALADYTKAIQIKSGFANAFWGRGNVYWKQKNYSLAATDYQSYFDLGGNNEKVRYYLDESKKRSND